MDNENTTTMDQATDAARRVGEQAREAGRRAFDQGRQVAHQAWDQGQHPQTQPSEQHREGRVARTIEQQTAKLPSDVFLWAALGATGGSLAFLIAGKKATSNFIGRGCRHCWYWVFTTRWSSFSDPMPGNGRVQLGRRGLKSRRTVYAL